MITEYVPEQPFSQPALLEHRDQDAGREWRDISGGFKVLCQNEAARLDADGMTNTRISARPRCRARVARATRYAQDFTDLEDGTLSIVVVRM